MGARHLGSRVHGRSAHAPVTGGGASVAWPGLANDTEYEWYAVASDGIATTPSATWSFTTAASGPGTFALSGTIRGTGGVALAGASVHVFSATGGTYLASVLSNGSGGYSFALPVGSYKLLVQASGYPEQWHGSASYDSATTIVHTGAQTVDVNLTSTFALSGTIRGTGGVALAGASVHVFSATGGTYLASVLSNGSGGYSFALPTGSYKLLVQASGYPEQWHGSATYDSATTIVHTGAQTVDRRPDVAPSP